MLLREKTRKCNFLTSLTSQLDYHFSRLFKRIFISVYSIDKRFLPTVLGHLQCFKPIPEKSMTDIGNNWQQSRK